MEQLQVQGNFIDGDWATDLSGDPVEVVNPANGQSIATVLSASPADVDRAISAADAAFVKWSSATPGERSGLVLKLANVLEDSAEELGRLESVNVGKPIPDAIEEMLYTVDCLRFIAGAARVPEGQAAGEYVSGHTSMIRRDPLGVCGQIVPWNYPLHIALVKSAQAIVVGNTVVAKPSELTPLTLLRFMELAGDILPAGVFNVVTGNGIPTGEAIVKNARVRVVGFTGDVSTGRRIAEKAAPMVKRLALELGGKSPVIIFGDADMEAVAKSLRAGAFANSGQDCQAASRVLVESSAYDNLLAELLPQVDQISVGDPEAGDIEMGPVVSAGQKARVLGFMERAVGAGATMLAGGEGSRPAGFFVEPTVIGDVHQNSEIVQREVFGPVVSIQRFEGEEQALDWANGLEYGLSSSVWSRDMGKCMRAAQRLQCGTVWLNCHFVSSPEMPHGGFKQSGYGKDYSKYALEEYTVVKHVVTNNTLT